MFQRENWRVALDALRSNKLRAFLTMLGVVIGSGCIVLVITISISSSRYIIAQIEGIGANLVYAELVHSGSKPAALADEISLGDLQAIQREIPQVAAVAGVHELPMTVDVAGVARAVNVVGVTDQYAKVRNIVMVRGRYFDAFDMQSRAKECVITRQLARQLSQYQDVVGQSLRLGELQFTIIGVFREKTSSFGQTEIQGDTALVPFPIVQYFAGNLAVGTLYATADRPQAVPLVTREIGEVLRSRHRRNGVEYEVKNLTTFLEAVRNISRVLSIVLLLIAGIALLISGIGIMNIMLVTVTERTREIGVRKAVGARRREILNQFLLESLIISGSGALLGVALAVSAVLVGETFLPSDFYVPLPWISVVLAIGVSLVTGLLFGYLPANKAAKLHPTESLRYE